MTKIFIYLLATALAMITWAVVIFFGTVEGWFQGPVAKQETTQSFVEAVERELDNQFVGSFAMAIIGNGTVELEKFHSVGKPLDRNTVFQVSSLSKWISAFGIMKLGTLKKVEVGSGYSYIHTRTSPNPGANRLLFRQRLPSVTAVFLLLVCIASMTGCSFYRPYTLDPLNSEAFVTQVQQKGKYIVLHTPEGAWHLKNIGVDNNSGQISGVIETLPANHLYYKTVKPEPKPSRIRHGDYLDDKDKPTHEIHIYATAIAPGVDSTITIPFSVIDKVEVYGTHVGATVGTYALTTVGVIVLLVILLSGLAFAPMI